MPQVLAGPAEGKDQVTNIKALYDLIGKGIAEVVVDEQGIEYCWRSHFGFAGEASDQADSDGDGTSDLEEARNWTNPFGPDSAIAEGTPDQRRQLALDAHTAAQILVDGKVASPADVADHQEKESFKQARELFEQGAAAQRRVQAWSNRRSRGQEQNGGTVPGMIVIDVEGDRPIGLVDHGGISNGLIKIPPLWPGGTVNANVTGLGKMCGQWESRVPRHTHFDFMMGGSSRVTTPINDNVFNPADPESWYLHDHATFVAGIIAANGTPGNWSDQDYFKGAAPQVQIRSYDSLNHFAELSAIPNSIIKDMRASNHSYGNSNGWGTPSKKAGKNFATWHGNLSNVPQNPPGGIMEDYKFGWYNSDSVTADNLARNKPYHLMVKAAGNDKDAGPMGNVIRVYDWSTGSPTTFTTELWCLTWAGADEVVAEFTGTGKYFVLDSETVFPEWNSYVVNIHWGGTTTIVYTILNAAIKTNGTSIVDLGIPESTGFDSLAGGFTVAKNPLLVGSVDTNALATSTFSSAGPTDDGRIKPDVVALGEGLEVGPIEQNPEQGTHLLGLGADSDDDRSQLVTGTSFAAPAVSGVVTLLSQYQENLRGPKEPLRSCTFKALLCHTADDIFPWGPDYESGWGVVNAQAAAEMIKTNGDRQKITEVYLTNGQVATAQVRPIPGQPMKVTISWNDPAGPPQPIAIDPPGTNPGYKILKHDLNLTIRRIPTSPAEIHYPFKPDPAYPLEPLAQIDPLNPGNPAGRGVNNRDTVEQVIIDFPVAGQDYEIKIAQQAGTTISSEWVSVIISGATTSTLFPPISNPAPIQYLSFDPYGGCYVFFRSVMGGYYKMQYIPYMAPPNSWTDAPMLGIIYSRGDNCSVQAYNITPGWEVPVRIVPVSPNPFNLSP